MHQSFKLKTFFYKICATTFNSQQHELTFLVVGSGGFVSDLYKLPESGFHKLPFGEPWRKSGVGKSTKSVHRTREMVHRVGRRAQPGRHAGSLKPELLTSNPDYSCSYDMDRARQHPSRYTSYAAARAYTNDTTRLHYVTTQLGDTSNGEASVP